jgi:hypothetical protein
MATRTPITAVAYTRNRNRNPNLTVNIFLELIPAIYGIIVSTLASNLPTDGCDSDYSLSILTIYTVTTGLFLTAYPIFTFLFPYLINKCIPFEYPDYALATWAPFPVVLTVGIILGQHSECVNNARWILTLVSTLLGIVKAIVYITYFCIDSHAHRAHYTRYQSV